MQPLDVGEPATVGPYRLLGRLGSGGMGQVYLGRSAGGRTVAVKIVHPHFALRVALNGTLPMGTFRVTVRQAGVGETFGTFRQTDLIGGHCDTVLVLKKATPQQITATSVAKKSKDSVCVMGRHEVRLTPVDDDLRYETDNSEAGDPVARMNKVE